MSQYLLQSAGINGTRAITSSHNINTTKTSNHISTLINKQTKPTIPEPRSIDTSTKTISNSNPTPNSNTNSKPNTNNANNHKNNNNTNMNNKSQIKVQTEFMDAMTNAITRYLDKNPDSSKTEAELSVFIALGYDKSIELNDNNTMEERISHFRRHHIMRNRDAIRTYRIKEMHQNIIKQYPKYTTIDVLIHLTTKLNLLYLPSPSPPPPPVSITNKPINDIENINEKKECKNNKNVLVNNKLNVEKKEKDNVIKNDKNNMINNIILTTDNKCKMNNKKQPVLINNNNRIKPIKNKQIYSKIIKKQFKNDLSPSQIYNKNRLLKYKKRDNIKCIRRDKAYKPSGHFIVSSSKPKRSSSIYYNESSQQLYKHSKHTIYYNDDEIIQQKIKLHKKSRKRKLNINTFDTFETFNNEFDNNKPPPKKRTRINKINQMDNVFDQHFGDDIDDDQSDIDNTIDTTNNSLI